MKLLELARLFWKSLETILIGAWAVESLVVTLAVLGAVILVGYVILLQLIG